VDERSCFEEWYEADAMPGESDWFKMKDDEYHHLNTQNAWEGFQACAKIKDEYIAELKAEVQEVLSIAYKERESMHEKIEQLNAKVAMLSEAIKEIWYSNSTPIPETKYYEVINATEAYVTKWLNGVKAGERERCAVECGKQYPYTLCHSDQLAANNCSDAIRSLK